MELSATCTSVGKLFPHVFPGGDEFRALLDQRVRAQEFLLVTLPGTA